MGLTRDEPRMGQGAEPAELTQGRRRRETGRVLKALGGGRVTNS